MTNRSPGGRSVPADGLLLATGTLTALPVPPPRRVDRAVARVALLLAPIAVLPVAVAAAAVLAVGNLIGWPGLLTGFLVVGAVLLATRALHLDGWSDTVDGLAASHDPQRSLAVMRTGTSGPAGTAATVLLIGVQATAIATWAGEWRGVALVAAVVCLSRWALLLPGTRGVVAARPGGLGELWVGVLAPAVTVGCWLAAAAALAGLAGWAGLPWWRGPVAVIAAAAAALLLLLRTRRRFGGATGDVLGACVELALAVLLVALIG